MFVPFIDFNVWVQSIFLIRYCINELRFWEKGGGGVVICFLKYSKLKNAIQIWSCFKYLEIHLLFLKHALKVYCWPFLWAKGLWSNTLEPQLTSGFKLVFQQLWLPSWVLYLISFQAHFIGDKSWA